jgi:DNA-binding NarL/FixJ family response regulator
LPGINGVEATRVIHQRKPEVRIIGLSMNQEPERSQAMRDAGAIEYLSKRCPAAELIAAIRANHANPFRSHSNDINLISNLQG